MIPALPLCLLLTFSPDAAGTLPACAPDPAPVVHHEPAPSSAAPSPDGIVLPRFSLRTAAWTASDSARAGAAVQPRPVRTRRATPMTYRFIGAAAGAVAGFYGGGLIGGRINGTICECGTDNAGQTTGALIGAPVGALLGAFAAGLFR